MYAFTVRLYRKGFTNAGEPFVGRAISSLMFVSSF